MYACTHAHTCTHARTHTHTQTYTHIHTDTYTANGRKPVLHVTLRHQS